MKIIEFIIPDGEDERIEVYRKENTPLPAELMQLACEEYRLLGYVGSETVALDVSEVYSFVTECGRVYALLDSGARLAVRERLWRLEELYPALFVRINQSSLAAISKLCRFDASISGTLRVTFKNGATDYVSRRSIKSVKERLGLK